jgi:hypothetical protein
VGETLHELLNPLTAPMFGEGFQFPLIEPDALALRTLINRDLMDLPLPEPRSTPRTAQVDEFTKELLLFVGLFLFELFDQFTVALGKKPILLSALFFVQELT